MQNTLRIEKPQQYQYVFFQHMDFYAQRNGLTAKGRKLTTSDVRQILDDVCQEIREIYKLSEGDHIVYKGMMEIILFGKNKGRKGADRR